MKTCGSGGRCMLFVDDTFGNMSLGVGRVSGTRPFSPQFLQTAIAGITEIQKTKNPTAQEKDNHYLRVVGASLPSRRFEALKKNETFAVFIDNTL